LKEAGVGADKILAMKTLGLTIDQAVTMGLIQPLPKAGDAAEPLMKRARKVLSGDTAADADKAKVKTGKVVQDGASSDASNEALVEGVVAVVCVGGAGALGANELAWHASDVAYLLSDPVLWPLVRRMTAEVLALDAGAGASSQGEEVWNDAWTMAPGTFEDAVTFAETRGYVLPEADASGTMASAAPLVGAATAAGGGAWRRELLKEIAADLMTTRMLMGVDFKQLPALASPPVVSKASDVTSEEVEKAGKLVDDLVKKFALSASGSLAQKLSAIATANAEKPCNTTEAASQLAVAGGKWSLLTEMGVREAATTLRKEYGVRRQILLRRLDVTVEGMSAGQTVKDQAAVQQKFADALATMWASWRSNSNEAPQLSEWSALSISKARLARCVGQRVSAASGHLTSSVRSVRIGSVPDRGGIPEGAKGARRSSAEITPSAGSSDAPAAPRAKAPKKSASSSTPAGGEQPAQPKMSESDGPVAMGSKPEDNKNIKSGARSTNKELIHVARKEAKDPKESTYYNDLENHRSGGAME
jgi:hypothetical protein